MGLINTGSNLATKATVNPKQSVTQGLTGSLITGGAFGGISHLAGGGGEEPTQRTTPQAAAKDAADAGKVDLKTANTWEKTDVNGTRVYQRDDLIDSTIKDKLGRTNVERMQEGLAPLGPDGKSINLHHMIQTADSPIAEVTQTFHQTFSKILHINPKTIPSGIDRVAFNAWKQAYWVGRAIDFLP